MQKVYYCIFFFGLLTYGENIVSAQNNLLLNGNFEDINTCTEYNAECGVEGWFYLKDVKAQMFAADNNNLLGSNSFGIFYNWLGYSGFTPVIGTMLPCVLKKNNRYIFKGIISAKLNPKLNFKPGICIGEKFYVPRRAFSKNMHPDTIVTIKKVPNTNFFSFEYGFTADGTEKYLTFGCYIEEDTLASKKHLIGTQTVSIVLDNFELIPEEKNEITCLNFSSNKVIIYNYNYRHKEMDYSLYGKGELAILLPNKDSNSITRIIETTPPVAKPDTLKLGDVFFDFNKAILKKDALQVLNSYFILSDKNKNIDSIYIEGHTDSIGSDARNLLLSQHRCESVKNWLEQKNITSSEKIQIRAFGKSKPVASNSTPAGRALNRRVEMIIFRKIGL